MSAQMKNRASLSGLRVDEASHFDIPANAADDLRTYLAALNANLQPYLREGKSLNSIGAPLSGGGAVFLLLFGSESQHQQIAIDPEVWGLEQAATALAANLHGENLPERTKRFVADVEQSGGKSPAVLIADNGIIFYRPSFDEQRSTYDVSAIDALNIAKSVA
jgi:hypothetical protein